VLYWGGGEPLPFILGVNMPTQQLEQDPSFFGAIFVICSRLTGVHILYDKWVSLADCDKGVRDFLHSVDIQQFCNQDEQLPLLFTFPEAEDSAMGSFVLTKPPFELFTLPFELFTEPLPTANVKGLRPPIHKGSKGGTPGQYTYGDYELSEGTN
jgi:hypothetical protein